MFKGVPFVMTEVVMRLYDYKYTTDGQLYRCRGVLPLQLSVVEVKITTSSSTRTQNCYFRTPVFNLFLYIVAHLYRIDARKDGQLATRGI